jgi:hypothetical protein
MELSERKIANIIYYNRIQNKNPSDFLLDISASPELLPLSNTIQDSLKKKMNGEIDMTQMYSLIKDEFDKYIIANPSVIDRDFTSITQRFPINNLVRPFYCRHFGILDYYDRFYNIILFLVVLLYMKHKEIPETEFFQKTNYLGFRSVSLLNHLRKKESDWLFRTNIVENCSGFFTELINVYNFVYSKPGLTLLVPKGGRRTRYRKRKSKARKSRRS